MADLFSMDAKDLIKLRKIYKRMPKTFNKAAAGTLNAFAFGTRKHSSDTIDREMTVRNPKFIHGSLKVDKAKGNVPLSRMESITGSIFRPRFTGLAEQELGKPMARNRALTSAARAGNTQSQAKGWARLKPNAKYPSPNKTTGLKTKENRSFSLQGLTGAKRILAFFHILSESKRDQTFIIRRRFGKFKRGLYRFRRGSIRKLQEFDVSKRPKRVKWLTMGRRRYFDSVDIGAVWAGQISFWLKKLK
jgi:hypothetical protein